jgi:hypothetical protein
MPTSKDQKYCVVAENRRTKRREDVTGEIANQDQAIVRKTQINMNPGWRKSHRYFSVAKFPYSDKRNIHNRK